MSQDDEKIKCPSGGGKRNETLIVQALNNKKFSELNANLQQMIHAMGENSVLPDTLIKAEKIKGNHKADIFVEINNQKYNISIKCGGSNSVHQEKVEDFISFLESEYNMDDKLKNEIRFFIWGDGTLNGTGEISNRMDANELKQKFPDVISHLKDFFHENKEQLIERFLINGAVSESIPDFIYYGTSEEGIIANAQDMFIWLCDDRNEKTKPTIPVGRFNFQAWNRNINGGDKSEHKRGVIQLKWSPIKSDIEKMLEER